MKIFSILMRQLYLLQLENYRLNRFWHLVWNQPPMTTQRQKLVWTQKTKLIFALSLGTSFLMALNLTSSIQNSPWHILATILTWLIIANLLAPVVLSLVLIILWPFDTLAKTLIVS